MVCGLFKVFPLALGYGYGAELRLPLGITILGGLVVSHALTLYTTPVLYLALDRLSTHLKRQVLRSHAVSETSS